MGRRNRGRDDSSETEHRPQKTKQLGQFKLEDIQPKTDNQARAFNSYWEGKELILHGMAGTGKTFISLWLALNDLQRGLADRIVIVRSLVPSREAGFLPGTLQEKLAIYEVPYREICSELFSRGDAYDLLKRKGQIHFISTSYVRGLTLNRAIVILDEAQNMTDHEIYSVLTRIGDCTRVIVVGDRQQNDLALINKRGQESGLDRLLNDARKMSRFDSIEFVIKDIVRSGFVKEYLLARIKLDR